MPDETHRPELITRREAILRVSALLGGVALVGQNAMLAACTRRGADDAPAAGAPFSAEDVAFLDEIAETMLPETGTPGAKAAGVGPFMALMVTDSYDPAEQGIFRDGMDALEARCRSLHGASFMAATPAQRLALLERLDAEQLQYMRSRAGGAPAHYFRMMKELALLGYFTSEIGCTQAMRYIETPGRFEPCVPYAPGEKTWAAHA
ncbi:MAG: gluconate 2-dehydrogenase subunit 3 family protein [Woeseiaceae bacterium]